MDLVSGNVCKLVSEETKLWLESADAEAVALALDFGREGAIRFMSRWRICTPTVLGQIGENHVEQALREAFPSIVNTSKVSCAGDLSLYIEHSKIIVEVKNYTNNVPKSGVVKFLRDLQTTHTDGAVFISLRTPISSITDSFIIRHEHIEDRSIPCVYIVSDEPRIIILAVNIIAQLIRARAHLLTDLYDRDKILATVHDMSISLDELAKSRNALNVNIGEIITRLFSASAGLALCESDLRCKSNEIKQELFHTNISNSRIQSHLESSQWYHKYGPDLRQYIAEIITIIDTEDAIWKISGAKFVCTSGVGFHLYSGRVEVIMPKSKMSYTNVLMMKISTTETTINITLDAVSFPIIKECLSMY